MNSRGLGQSGAAAFAVILAFVASSAGAQTITVSGRVLEEGRGTAIQGATVRLTGADAVRTDSLGRFSFAASLPGRLIVTASIIGYEFRSVELLADRDTSLTIRMPRRLVMLDTMIVRPRSIRLRGTAVDSASGDKLLWANATIYPSGNHVGARSGTFVFDSVPPFSEVMIIVEALEHLPTRVFVTASKDTAFRVQMGIDSVALRMIAVQVTRLQTRSRGTPMSLKAINRNAIMQEGAMSIGEVVTRRLTGGPLFRRPGEALARCEYLDEVKVVPGSLQDLLPELVERVELYGSPRKPTMIRVYTKRYVASLIGRETVPWVFFEGKGVTPQC